MSVGLDALRVLVIDDNAQMRSIVGTILGAAGVSKLYYAQSARDGIDLISSVPVDVIYVDQEMPGMGGIDFVRWMRGLSGPEQFTAMIMLTGHSDLHHLTAARDSGINEFLGKPVTAKAILTRLEAVIMRPRPFVRSESFVGPDRRRRRDPGYSGPRRREADKNAFV